MTARSLTLHGALPGVRCSVALPAADDPVRLDVTGFVGLAERGPLDVPVAVEDTNQYETVFGGDLAVATLGGVPVYAQLPSAVRAFFDNGGRRCCIVRVAGPLARPARWAVPGLQVWQRDGTVDDAYVEAAWPGAWSSSVRVGAQLLAQPLAIHGPYERVDDTVPGLLRVGGVTASSLAAGDLVRLDLGAGQPGLFVRLARSAAGYGELPVDLEWAFEEDAPEVASIAVRPRADLLAALPSLVEVRAAWLLRLDLLARGPQPSSDRAGQLERWPDLTFNAGEGPGRRPVWTSVLQPADVAAPDPSRSLLLRADAVTSQLMSSGLVVPCSMDQLVGFNPAAAVTPDGGGSSSPAAAGDDDLGRFDPVQLFLDPALASSTVHSLVADADQLTVLAARPTALHGIHALTEVEEVALIAVPDATHRGWSPVPPQPPAAPDLPPVPEPVDWSDFRCCVVPPPAVDGGDKERRPPTDPIAGLPVLDAIEAYDEGGLIEVQVALTTLCAARADAVAVLSLPRHYDTTATLDWHERLIGDGRLIDSGATAASPLSFAAYWHPWAQVLEPVTPELSPLRDIAPDGAVTGMIAATEQGRGVWVAPAARTLRGPVQVVPDLTPAETVRLFDVHANLLASRPGAVATRSAHTLCDDPRLLQLSVRRLIVLVRKLALVHGHRYTFETNTDRFRQLVRMRFEQILFGLQSAGALVAFAVTTDDGTEKDGEAGRLVVSLQLAPTIPIEFITVSLLRSGENLLDVREA